jgi:hypothetical protein
MRLDTGIPQDGLEHLADAKASLSQLHQWLMANVVGNDVLPKELPGELGEYLGALHKSIENAESGLREIIDAHSLFFFTVLSKRQQKQSLSEFEYYLLRAHGLITGVSDIDSEFSKYSQSSSGD